MLEADRESLEERVRRLETRLAALEDERAIRDVLDRYGWHADHGEHDAWVELFTEDGVMCLVGGAPGTAAATELRWAGAERLLEFIGDPDMHMRIEGRCMHLPALCLRVEQHGDRAVAHGCSIVLVQEADGPRIYGSGFTRWRLRRQALGWRIEERTRLALGSGPERTLDHDARSGA